MPDCTCAEWYKRVDGGPFLGSVKQDPNCPLHGTGRAKECTCGDSKYGSPDGAYVGKDDNCPVHPPSQETKDEVKTLRDELAIRLSEAETAKHTLTNEPRNKHQILIDYLMPAIQFYASTVADKACKEAVEAFATRVYDNVEYVAMSKHEMPWPERIKQGLREELTVNWYKANKEKS